MGTPPADRGQYDPRCDLGYIYCILTLKRFKGKFCPELNKNVYIFLTTASMFTIFIPVYDYKQL